MWCGVVWCGGVGCQWGAVMALAWNLASSEPEAAKSAVAPKATVSDAKATCATTKNINETPGLQDKIPADILDAPTIRHALNDAPGRGPGRHCNEKKQKEEGGRPEG